MCTYENGTHLVTSMLFNVTASGWAAGVSNSKVQSPFSMCTRRKRYCALFFYNTNTCLWSREDATCVHAISKYRPR